MPNFALLYCCQYKQYFIGENFDVLRFLKYIRGSLVGIDGGWFIIYPRGRGGTDGGVAVARGSAVGGGGGGAGCGLVNGWLFNYWFGVLV